MIRFMDETNGAAIGIHIGGDIATEDFTALADLLRDAIDQYDRIRLLLRIDKPGEVPPAVLWEQLKLAIDIYSAIDRIALVGESGWERAYAKIIGGIVETPMRHFDPVESEVAWAWVRG